jgi:hypothetical protein
MHDIWTVDALSIRRGPFTSFCRSHPHGLCRLLVAVGWVDSPTVAVGVSFLVYDRKRLLVCRVPADLAL